MYILACNGSSKTTRLETTNNDLNMNQKKLRRTKCKMTTNIRENANKSFGILSYHFLFYLVVIVLRLVTFLERQAFNSSKLVEFCLNFLTFRRACHDEVPTGLRSSSSFTLHVRPGPSWEVRCLIVSPEGIPT